MLYKSTKFVLKITRILSKLTINITLFIIISTITPLIAVTVSLIINKGYLSETTTRSIKHQINHFIEPYQVDFSSLYVEGLSMSKLSLMLKAQNVKIQSFNQEHGVSANLKELELVVSLMEMLKGNIVPSIGLVKNMNFTINLNKDDELKPQSSTLSNVNYIRDFLNKSISKEIKRYNFFLKHGFKMKDSNFIIKYKNDDRKYNIVVRDLNISISSTRSFLSKDHILNTNFLGSIDSVNTTFNSKCNLTRNAYALRFCEGKLSKFNLHHLNFFNHRINLKGLVDAIISIDADDKNKIIFNYNISNGSDAIDVQDFKLKNSIKFNDLDLIGQYEIHENKDVLKFYNIKLTQGDDKLNMKTDRLTDDIIQIDNPFNPKNLGLIINSNVDIKLSNFTSLKNKIKNVFSASIDPYDIVKSFSTVKGRINAIYTNRVKDFSLQLNGEDFVFNKMLYFKEEIRASEINLTGNARNGIDVIGKDIMVPSVGQTPRAYAHIGDFNTKRGKARIKISTDKESESYITRIEDIISLILTDFPFDLTHFILSKINLPTNNLAESKIAKADVILDITHDNNVDVDGTIGVIWNGKTNETLDYNIIYKDHVLSIQSTIPDNIVVTSPIFFNFSSDDKAIKNLNVKTDLLFSSTGLLKVDVSLKKNKTPFANALIKVNNNSTDVILSNVKFGLNDFSASIGISSNALNIKANGNSADLSTLVQEITSINSKQKMPDINLNININNAVFRNNISGHNIIMNSSNYYIEKLSGILYNDKTIGQINIETTDIHKTSDKQLRIDISSPHLLYNAFYDNNLLKTIDNSLLNQKSRIIINANGKIDKDIIDIKGKLDSNDLTFTVDKVDNSVSSLKLDFDFFKTKDASSLCVSDTLLETKFHTKITSKGCFDFVKRHAKLTGIIKMENKLTKTFSAQGIPLLNKVITLNDSGGLGTLNYSLDAGFNDIKKDISVIPTRGNIIPAGLLGLAVLLII